jgi:hypothetical protein
VKKNFYAGIDGGNIQNLGNIPTLGLDEKKMFAEAHKKPAKGAQFTPASKCAKEEASNVYVLCVLPLRSLRELLL